MSDEVLKLQEELREETNRFSFATSKLKDIDNAIQVRKRRFEAFRDTYNEQAKRFQELKDKTEKKIDKIKEKLAILQPELSELFICPHCKKEYKTQKGLDNHIPKCATEQEQIQEQQKRIAELEAKKKALQKELDLKRMEAAAEELGKEEEAKIEPEEG